MSYSIPTYAQLRMGLPGAEIVDAIINDSIFSIPVPGDGCINYATALAESTMWNISNFAYSSSPANPITGQLWYDTATRKLKVRTDRAEWEVVEQIGVDSSNISEDILPAEDIIFSIGTEDKRYLSLSANNIYITTAQFKNTFGTTPNIMIDGNGHPDTAMRSSGYTDSSGVSTDLNASIAILHTKFDGQNIASGIYTEGTPTANPSKVHVTNNSVHYIGATTAGRIEVIPNAYGVDFQVIVKCPKNTTPRLVSITNPTNPLVASGRTTYYTGLFNSISWTADLYVRNTDAVTAKAVNYINGFGSMLQDTAIYDRNFSWCFLHTDADGEWDVIITEQRIL